ncbi:MAG: hypothetical protein HKL95_10725, partial [Phycisphaerae bacterium]|nr:hypothetical protein [Phycisphaerae bacterium]
MFNGQTWKHYGLFHGPLGCHIFAIAVNPKNHSVWMATDGGIAIYQAAWPLRKHPATRQRLAQRLPRPKWRYITRTDGLPENLNSIALLPNGTAIIGTQCDGIAIACRPYRHWRVIRGPQQAPARAFGGGLLSSFVNS